VVTRHPDLFDRIAEFGALMQAARRAVRGKRGKPGAAAFMAGLETEVLRLQRELHAGTWRPGRYVEIEVFVPKHRVVSAAPFRDRVVHHALCAIVEPIFELGFIFDSYVNRLGKGTHKAVARYERYRDYHRHVLRCDIYRYFPAIDHEILKADLRRRIACPRTLRLLDAVIDGSNPQEPVHLHYPGDDLLTPLTRRRGLPIGNLTSQFFANVYLDGLDHFAKEVLRAPYLRYVDDFALFDDDPAVLAEWQARITAYLARRRLSLHPGKTLISSNEAPATFLGFVLLPGGRRRLPEGNVRRFRNRLRGLRDRYHAGTVDLGQAMRHIRSWVAHAAHADTWRLREAVFRDAVFDPWRRPGRSPAASSAAAPGTTTHGTCARPTATTTHRTTETTISAFGLPRHPAAGAGVFTETTGARGCVQDRS
jgi:retron-type reverse transcriptase